MSDNSNTNWVSSVIYGPANQMLQMVANSFTENRTYNANLELIEVISGSNVHFRYNYPWRTDDGQIASQTDVISGEVTTYQYDSLQRLISASATGDPSGSWSQAFTYDGFGNLTQKSSSNAPALSVAVDPATNRILSNASYDANGNMTGYSGAAYGYDLQNRMIQASASGGGSVAYGYDSANHRIYKGALNGTTYSAEEIYFYGVDGHKYGTWQINPSAGVLLQTSVTKQWFGRHLVTPEDHLQSRGKYYAFGEERTGITPANPPNDQEKFATYTRDSATGLDYADQRYYGSVIGRFMRPDPSEGSSDARMPQSWNRYSYVGNDPIDYSDPSGLCAVYIGGITETPTSDSARNQFLTSIGAIQAYPYFATQTGLYSAAVGIGSVAIQAVTDNITSQAADAAVAAAASYGPVNIITDSGGAQALANAIALNPALINSISSVTYIDPITTSLAAPLALPNTNSIVGGGAINLGLVTTPAGTPITYDSCAHGNLGCHLQQEGSFIADRSGGPCPTQPTITAYLPSYDFVTYPGQYGMNVGINVTDALTIEGLEESGSGNLTSVYSQITYGIPGAVP